MIKPKLIVLFFLLGLILLACDPDLKTDKYARPDWLAGKVYTQLKAQPNLTTFTRCVELTGYDSIIDRSGSYTVFAPDDDAFSIYFQMHPVYNSVEDIPLSELEKIVKYHLVQNPWTKTQLRTLDVYGWIDTLDLNNNKPRGFKRQTLLLDKNRKVGVLPGSKGNLEIVDTLDSDWHRVVATDSRKYVPIFFKEYFDIYDLRAEDYEFYFDRTVDDVEAIYFAGAMVIGDELFAENGFVYTIDRVVDPLPNSFQALEEAEGTNSYTDFLELINLFPDFEYNEQRTYDQPGADEGFEVDSLFDMNYPELTFDILNEKTTPPAGTFGLPSNVTIRYHHGLMAPTNLAFSEFFNEYFVGSNRWGSLDAIPRNIKRIIVNTHMSDNSIYPSDFENGFLNGEMDLVTLDQTDIVDKRFSSNSTFIGLSKAVVPRVFKSVAGPVYLLRGYSKTMFAIEDAGLISALKREGENYMFYAESNINTSLDSSLLYESTFERFSLFQIAQGSSRQFNLSTNDLRALLMNHIAVGSPSGLARKEFFKNLAGNYIIIDNETGEVKGTSPTSVGYQGQYLQANYPTQISTDADNGFTFDIENWFSFSATNIFQKIRSDYPKFHALLNKAGLSNEFELRYTFLSENENYTVFAPTDSALLAYGADTLKGDVLRQFLKFHFIQGELIFTDGKLVPAYYETMRVDNKSTTYTKLFSKIFIDPGYDIISIPDKLGETYTEVEESPVSNVMTGRDNGETTTIFGNLIINGVIHEIERVLVYDELDTN